MSKSSARRCAPVSLSCLAALGLIVAPRAPAAEEETLQEVLVTATILPRSVAQLPASVTVLGADTLATAGRQHFEDVLGLVPNLNWASGTSRPRYFQLRGIGENDQWQGAPNPSVGFLIDGIDFSGLGMPATLFDVERVEVLRGPQGTTYGANALAGLIALSSRAPTPEASGRLEVEAGEFGTGSIGGVAGGALGALDGASWRAVAQHHRSDGFRRNVFLDRDDTNGFDETTLRGRLRYEPDDRTRVDLSTLWVDLDNGYDAFAIDNGRVTRSDKPGRDAQRSAGASLAIEHRLRGTLALRSLSAAADSDIVYSFDGDWGADPGYDFFSRFLRGHRSLSQDLRLSDRGGPVEWAAGVYGLRVTETNDQLDLFDGAVFRALVSRYRATNLALYGEARHAFGGVWSVNAGLRIEERRARYRDTDGSDFAPRDRMWGGQVSLQRQLGERTQLYATVSRGYKGGGFNIGALVPPERREFGPEYLLNVELGAKGATADRRLEWSAAAFLMRRREQQVGTSFQIDPSDPLSFLFVTDNAARGRNAGLEANLASRLGERWRATAALAWLNAEYVDYRQGARDLAGRDQAHAPRWTYGLALEYGAPTGWFARADVQGRDAFYFSDSHDERSRAYALVNLRAGYATERWQASLWVRNLFDRDYAQRGFFFGNEPPDFPEKLYVQPGDPRQVGVSLRYEVR